MKTQLQTAVFPSDGILVILALAEPELAVLIPSGEDDMGEALKTLSISGEASVRGLHT